jgi:hypothetical protein
MQPKQNPTDPEALLLIRLRRRRAKAAMDQIVKRYGVISHEPEPGLEVLLDYLSNMVYALELLLKVLADDWRTPGKSHFGHRVGDMYQEVFGCPHPCPDLMPVLERAILNQKFIYEPADRLMDYVPELEALWDELTTAFYQRRWMEDIVVRREVVAPARFIQYLRDNLDRFYLAQTYHWKPPLAREDRIRLLQYQIQSLQKELDQVEAGEEPPEDTPTQLTERLQREYLEALQGAATCFDFNAASWNGEFSFGTWSFGKVLPGCLD